MYQELTTEKNWVMEAVGDAMSPTIDPGDLVMIDRSVTKILVEGVYFLRQTDPSDGNERYLIQRVQRLPPDRLRLSYDNPKFENDVIDRNQPGFEVLGRVVRVGKVQRL